jgi:hypothetical protein
MKGRQPVRGGPCRQAFRIKHGLGKPGADIGFTPGSCALQAIETQPRHDGDEKSFGVLHTLRAGKPQIGILHDVLCIAAAAKHPIGEAKQAPAMGRQRIAVMRPV